MKMPVWVRVVAVVLILWGIAGVFAFYQHATVGPDAMPGATDYDRAFYRARPLWFDMVYLAAVGGGFLGSIALLLRSRLAISLYVVSLIAVLIQFGYVFLATDLIAVKGAAETVPFPIVILAVALFQLWLARRARARGWIA